jgi:hypothetical protein
MPHILSKVQRFLEIFGPDQFMLVTCVEDAQAFANFSK